MSQQIGATQVVIYVVQSRARKSVQIDSSATDRAPVGVVRLERVIRKSYFRKPLSLACLVGNQRKKKAAKRINQTGGQHSDISLGVSYISQPLSTKYFRYKSTLSSRERRTSHCCRRETSNYQGQQPSPKMAARTGFKKNKT